ncbi:hypothetical protein GW17_00039048 [Ensete ventricosum]|nr:hypothetical protein GW17_00039048 [Ensete ventricosum]
MIEKQRKSTMEKQHASSTPEEPTTHSTAEIELPEAGNSSSGLKRTEDSRQVGSKWKMPELETSNEKETDAIIGCPSTSKHIRVSNDSRASDTPSPARPTSTASPCKEEEHPERWPLLPLAIVDSVRDAGHNRYCVQNDQCGGRDEKGGPFEEVEFPKTSTEQSATSVPHPPAAKSAWGSAKETMQKIKDTVVGKAEESQQSIKDGRENTKRAMDAKN